jgi:hypothetical protein
MIVSMRPTGWDSNPLRTKPPLTVVARVGVAEWTCGYLRGPGSEGLGCFVVEEEVSSDGFIVGQIGRSGGGAH